MKKVACTKTSFIDENFAMQYINILKKTSKRERKPVRAYLCEHCLTWHLTSTDPINKEIKHLKRQIHNLKLKLSEKNDIHRN